MLSTQLKTRTLWYDGAVTCAADDIQSFISKVPANKLYVDRITPEIRQYNALVDTPLTVKLGVVVSDISFDWVIPEKYETIALLPYLMDRLNATCDNDAELDLRFIRLRDELTEFTERGLLDVLRCLIYVVDRFTETGQVWGIGRGSSVSSYLLYLIGVHDIDSFTYNLPISDFLK